MTASDFWLALSRGGRIEELERSECRALLAATSVGRLGYVTDDGPRVVPVNFAVAEGNVIFRTLAYGEVARCTLGRRVAFEVDEVDQLFRSGWSVLVVATAELLTEEQFRRLHPAEWPEPYAEGPRTLFVQIPITHLSGRRVLPA